MSCFGTDPHGPVGENLERTSLLSVRPCAHGRSGAGRSKLRKNGFRYGLVALVFLAGGFWLGREQAVEGEDTTTISITHRALGTVLGAASRFLDLRPRLQLLAENPELLTALRRGAPFGGVSSVDVATGMFSREPNAIRDVRQSMEIVEVAPRSWQIRLSVVNASLFETDEGLVLVDTGMSPAGPALLDAIREVSDKPLHTIIYTHGHVDHAYGAWAFLDGGQSPRQIVAHEKILDRFDRYLKLRGSISKYMSQPLEHLPKSRADLIWPTRTFAGDRLDLDIGGERFSLYHYPAETDDQLFVWIPGRGILQAADYYQGFLPNAGNGKRVQRYVESWSEALRKMVSLEPDILLPGHGAELVDPGEIRENLTVLADTLDYIATHTIDGLNRGQRQDEIVDSLVLPSRLSEHPTMQERYVSPKDISRTVLRQYTGWWNDLPSHWTPAPVADQGRAIVELAGGMEIFVAKARRIMRKDLQIAAHLADHAYFGYPEDPKAQDLAFDVYRARILDPSSNTMEMVAYLDLLTEIRMRRLEHSRR